MLQESKYITKKILHMQYTMLGWTYKKTCLEKEVYYEEENMFNCDRVCDDGCHDDRMCSGYGAFNTVIRA